MELVDLKMLMHAGIIYKSKDFSAEKIKNILRTRTTRHYMGFCFYCNTAPNATFNHNEWNAVAPRLVAYVPRHHRIKLSNQACIQFLAILPW